MTTEAKSPPKRRATMFINVLIGIVVLIAVFLLYVSQRPSEFRVSRSQLISAPPGIVFKQVNNLHMWDAWSPWEKLDPTMKKTFEGPEEGVGAVSRWEGNSQVGSGSNTIVQSKPNEAIHFKLEMLKPFQGTNQVEFTFEPQGDQTVATWTMTGKLVFVTKIMDTLIGMDKMIGDQFQIGLKQLKAVCEADAGK